MDDKIDTQIGVSSVDGEFNYETGDSIQGRKGGTRYDVRDMTRMGKQQELRVSSP